MLMKPLTVQNCDVSATVADNSRLLQSAGSFGDALSANAEHAGNQFLCHDQVLGIQPVERQQKPAAQLLLDRMMAVAYRSLRYLRDQRLGITQQQPLYGTSAVKRLYQHARLHAVT